MIDEFKNNLRRARAAAKGEALSVARMIKPLADIDSGLLAQGQEQPHPTGVAVRMLDGDPMRYWSDGSLRHALGHKPGKAARKALKKMRRKK